MSPKKTIIISTLRWFRAFPPFFVEMSFYHFFWRVTTSRESFLFATRRIPTTPSIARSTSSGDSLSLHRHPRSSASPTGVTWSLHWIHPLSKSQSIRIPFQTHPFVMMSLRKLSPTVQDALERPGTWSICNRTPISWRVTARSIGRVDRFRFRVFPFMWFPGVGSRGRCEL